MRKTILFIIIFVLLSLPVYSQSGDKGSLFFSAAFGRVFFSENRTLEFVDHLRTTMLDYLQVGANWERPMGFGNFTLGLEAGYSFGIRTSPTAVDKSPVNLRTSYVIPLFDFFYLGPSLKLGGLGVYGPERTRWILLAGARVDAELRSPSFPLGLFVAGGFDLHPTAVEPDIVPVMEIGLRFPRGRLGARDQQTRQAAAHSSQFNQQRVYPTEVTHIMAALALLSPEPAVMTAQVELQAMAAMAQIEAHGVQALDPDHSEFVEIDDTLGIMRPVYFEPDTAVLVEIYRPVLELVGQKLVSNPNLRLHMQAFAAPFRTEPGRYAVSESRAVFCQRYLMEEFGIETDRITYEAFGSARLPPHAEVGHWETYRSVELIVISD